MKISEIITDRYKLRISPTVYYDLLADVQEAEEEQEPKTGHWECNELFYNGESRGAIITCSKCGNEFKVSPKVFENLYSNERFCNHCGAKMEVEE